MSKRNSVTQHVRDEYKFQHTRTTTSVYTDSNNQRHTVQNKQVSTATQERSFQSQPQYLSITGGSSTSSGSRGSAAVSYSGPRNRATYTQTSKTTYKGPNNERYTYSDRNFNSSIQKSSYNPPQQNAIGGGGYGYSNYGNGDALTLSVPSITGVYYESDSDYY